MKLWKYSNITEREKLKGKKKKKRIGDEITNNNKGAPLPHYLEFYKHNEITMIVGCRRGPRFRDLFGWATANDVFQSVVVDHWGLTQSDQRDGVTQKGLEKCFGGFHWWLVGTWQFGRIADLLWPITQIKILLAFLKFSFWAKPMLEGP